jgi:hypothetical protein
LKSVILASISLGSGDELYHYHRKEAAKKSQQWRLLDISLVYVCLSKNFSMSTEKIANPAQPIHAAFGPPRADIEPPVTHPAIAVFTVSCLALAFFREVNQKSR